MSTLETIDSSILYCMFKGDPGTRKSTQALSFPTPQYWFSWDRKMQGLMLPMRAWGIDPKLIHYDDYDDWTKPRQKLESFQLNCDYSTLIFDSITTCADMILRQTTKSKGNVTRASGQKAGMQIAGIPINEIEDYNAESSALNELIALTKDIQTYQKSQGKSITIILIAHVMEVTKQVQGNMTTSRTIVTAGKRVAAKIPAYCSEVYHFGIEKSMVVGQGGDYMLSTHNTGDDFARTSLPLDKEIKFGDKPLYDTWIKPAIDKMKEKPQVVTRIK